MLKRVVFHIPRVQTDTQTQAVIRRGKHEDIGCVGCGGMLDPFARSGTVLEGIRHITKEVLEEDHNGDEFMVQRRLQFWKRNRGLICSSCQGDYRTIAAKKRIGNSDLFETVLIPFVKVDSILKRPNETEGKKQYKVLNTRVTQ